MNDVFYIFRREFYTIFRDHGVMTFFVLLTLAYPIVYTYIYSNEVVREVPVAVVDHAASPLSREFVRLFEASPNAEVAARCADMEAARELMRQKKVYGILELPEDFSKRINRGEQAHAGLYCDMGALLNYKALLQAVSNVSALMNAGIQVASLPYASQVQQEIAAMPVQVQEVKMFNPQSGFASFIIPAVLVLVIQQSLLLGVGTITGTLYDRKGVAALVPRNSHYRRAWCIVLGKGCAYLLLYFVMAYWVFFVVPRIFGLVQIGVRGDLMLFLFPFLLACVFLAIACSFLCREREQPFLLFVFTSVPLMFISGISWPKEGIPEYWLALAKVFPSTHGIDGFVKINNMGATLSEVVTEYASLWFLALVYFSLACFLYRREIVKQNNNDLS